MYEVIHFFTDLQDNDHPYRVGDTFPRSGMTASQKRLAELSGAKNKQGIPLIREVPAEPADDFMNKPVEADEEETKEVREDIPQTSRRRKKRG